MRAQIMRATPSEIVMLEPGRCLYYALLTSAVTAVGLLCLRTTTAPNASLAVEFSLNRLIYSYVFAATAVVFMTLGYVLRRQIDELRRLASTDPLTGLQNRRGLQLKLRAECSRLEPSAPLSLLLIDVDGLKAINDEHGHAAGDRVLKSVAAAIRMTVRATDFGSRWGGDEFAIVAPRTDRDAADRLAERLQHHLTRHSRAADLAVSVSVGVVVVEGNGAARAVADDLMRAADEALYRAKNGGRNQVQVARRRESPMAGRVDSVLQS
jgi:diguanylate cyclase (GGDEF)-like protein